MYIHSIEKHSIENMNLLIYNVYMNVLTYLRRLTKFHDYGKLSTCRCK